MTVKEFRPEGTTDADTPDQQVLFNSDVTGPQGAHYYLFREAQHSDEDIKIAKRYIRNNFDAVSIHIIKETV
jgi:hypothetical protein